MFGSFAMPMPGKTETQGFVKADQPIDVLCSNDNKAQHELIHPLGVESDIGTSASEKWALNSNFPPSALMVAARVLSLTSPRFSNREIAGCFTPAFFANVT